MSERINWQHVMEVGYDRQLSWSEYSALKGAQRVSRGYYYKVRRTTGSTPADMKEYAPTEQIPVAAGDTKLCGNIKDERRSIETGSDTVKAGSDSKLEAILAQAHMFALEASVSDITVEVVGVIGPRLTALCAGYKSTKSMYRWVSGKVPIALAGSRGPRLRLAYELIWILGKLGLSTPGVKTWFEAIHPKLGATPAQAIWAGRYAAVIAAACQASKPKMELDRPCGTA